MAVGKTERVITNVTLNALDEEVTSKIANVLNYAKSLIFVKSVVTGTNTVTVYLEGAPNVETDEWEVINSATISATGYVVLATTEAYGAIRVRCKMTSFTDGSQIIDAWINRKRH